MGHPAWSRITCWSASRWRRWAGEALQRHRVQVVLCSSDADDTLGLPCGGSSAGSRLCAEPPRTPMRFFPVTLSSSWAPPLSAVRPQAPLERCPHGPPAGGAGALPHGLLPLPLLQIQAPQRCLEEEELGRKPSLSLTLDRLTVTTMRTSLQILGGSCPGRARLCVQLGLRLWVRCWQAPPGVVTRALYRLQVPQLGFRGRGVYSSHLLCTGPRAWGVQGSPKVWRATLHYE